MESVKYHRDGQVFPFDARSLHALQRQGDALSAADATREDPAAQPVSAHGIQQTRDKDGTGRTNRITMRDVTALYVDDILRQTTMDRCLARGVHAIAG